MKARTRLISLRRVLPAIVLAALVANASRAGEVLSNGIELPATWPPEIRHLGGDPMPVPYLESPPEVIPIDRGRQLFVDSFLIESTTLTQKYHSATVHKYPVLTPDKAWEAGTDSNPPTAMTFSGGAWYDPQDQLYKMWYSAGFNQAVGYAQSTNGVTWTKPNLDVVPGTNIVYSGAHDSNTVWLDQSATDPGQRFKMMLRDNASGQHQIRYSADGIHWSAVVATSGAAFDRSTFFHNPFRDVWVMSVRGDAYNPVTETVSGSFAGRPPFDGGGGTASLPRMRRYAEGETLVEAAQSWPTTGYSTPEWWQNTTVPTMWIGADNLDLPHPDRGITPELYNLDSVAYESVMAGMFSIWHRARTESPDRDKINNIKVGFSRDGFHWDRTNRTPIIDVSEDPEAWNYSNVQSAGGSLLTVGDQLYIYTSGRQGRFSGVSSTGLSTMRRDGFASMAGGQQGGTLTTRPVAFSGKYLFVNTDAIGGQLQAEILDQNGNVIGPFSRQNSLVISSDSTSSRISWNGVSDLSGLAGQPVKFRFYATNSSLYSFWVSPDESGASYGNVGAGGPGFTGPIDTVGTSGMVQVSVIAAADATISNRPDLRALNAGHAIQAWIGTGGTSQDNGVALVRFDLSGQQGREAIGNGILTLRQVLGQNSKNFDGQSLDLYAMSAENADWEEGVGQMSEVDGVAWNRKSGPYSTSPLAANRWLPTDANDPTSAIRHIDSIIWDDNAGQDSAVFAIPKEELDQWLSDGFVSFMIRSDSAETLLDEGDLTQRTWYMATLETGDGARAPRLSFTTTLPEPCSLTLLITGLIGSSVARRRKCLCRLLCGILACVVMLQHRSIVAGESQYNGIELPEAWPPEIRHFNREPMPVPYLASPPKVIPIDVGRQLFVDDFLIENTTLTRTFHRAEIHAASPMITPDRPWEREQKQPKDPAQAMPFSDGVWFDPLDQLFKLWYVAGWNRSTCYATSPDGIRWTKPNLDVVPETNIVQPGLRDSSTVWLDHREKDSQRRFKMMRRDDGNARHMLHFSPDGIHWSDGTPAGNAFDRSTFFFNPFRNVWVFSIRGDSYWDETETAEQPLPPRFSKGHWISLPRFRRYREGKEFLAAAQSWPGQSVDDANPDSFKHWHDPSMWVWADRLDVVRPDVGTAPELYNLDAVAYESLMLGMFTIWRGHTSEYPARDKVNEVCVGFSRDGFHWHRPWRESFIGVSEDPQVWNYCNVQSAGGCCLVVGDKLHFYVSGRMTRDITKKQGHSSTGLATLRRDGFASMDAGAEEGVLLTRPVQFTGEHLFVNVDNPQGSLQAEVLDEAGQVIAAFGREKCEVVRADSTCYEVRFSGIENLSSLKDQPVRLKFFLTGGKLYSFWVAKDKSGASGGYVAAGGPGFAGPTDAIGQFRSQSGTPQKQSSESPAKASLPSPIRVACVGDSITKGVGTSNPTSESYPAQLGKLLGEKYQVKNFGHSGATALKDNATIYLEKPEFKAAVAFQPNVVIIKLGTNDADPPAWREHKHRFKADYNILVDRFVELDSKPQVYLCLPAPIRPGKYDDRMKYLRDEVSPIIREIAREQKLTLIDLHTPLAEKLESIPDFVHPNAEGGAVIAQSVIKVLAP